MPTPVDVSLRDSFDLLSKHDIAPPGADFEAYVEEGIKQLTLGQQVHTVTFGTAKASLNYVFDEFIIYNHVDTSPIVLGYVETSKSTAGFEVTVTALPDTGNYYLRWKVRIPTTLVDGVVTATSAATVNGSVTRVDAVGTGGISVTVSNPTTAPSINLSLADGAIQLAKLAETVLVDNGTVATKTGNQTLTNKLIDGNNNTLQNIPISALGASGGLLVGELTDPGSDQMLMWDSDTSAFRFMGSPGARGIQKEAWLSNRTDGVDGTGSSDDPFDASTTSKLDAVMATFGTYTAINFAKSATVYQTTAGHSWKVLTGWTIDLHGSTLQLVGDVSAISLTGIFGNSSGTPADYVTIKNGTLDGNWTTLNTTAATGSGGRTEGSVVTTSGSATISFPANKITAVDYGKAITGTGISGSTTIATIVDTTHATMSAVATASGTITLTLGGEKNIAFGVAYLFGSHNRLLNLRGINTYGSNANSKEHFVFGLSAPTTVDAYDNVIQDCVAEQPYGNYGSPFAIHVGVIGAPQRYIRESHVFNCRASGINNGIPNGFTSGGVNLASNKDCSVEGCEFVDCRSIAYQDTGSQNNLTVCNNKLIRGWFGIGAGTASADVVDGLIIENNEIDIQDRVSGGASYGIVTQGTSIWTNYKITGNKLTSTAATISGAGGIIPLRAFGRLATSGSIENNKFPAETSYLDGSLPTVINNRKMDGTVAPGLVDNTYDRFGSGTPEGSITAPIGTTYRRTNGGTGTSFYIKESGTGNTGWVAHASVTPFPEFEGIEITPPANGIIVLEVNVDGFLSIREPGGNSMLDTEVQAFTGASATLSGLTASRLVTTDTVKTLASVTPQSTTGTTTGFTAGAGTAVLSDSTFTGGSGTKAYTIGDVVKHLKAIGALASS